MNPVVNYIENCDSYLQEIMFTLHDVFVNDFGLTPKIKFRIPFYYGKTWVVYLHPLKKGGMELCYTRATLFEDPTGLLEFKGRKQIAGITITKLSEMPMEAIFAITKVALELDASRD